MMADSWSISIASSRKCFDTSMFVLKGFQEREAGSGVRPEADTRISFPRKFKAR